MFDIKWELTKNKGRGVFAARDFKPGEIIEICPVLVMTPEETKNYDNTILGNYLFEWENEEDGGVILGYGLLYNHSYTPNAEYIRDFTNITMVYKAVRDIKTGEEICVNYNGHPSASDPIDWFDVK